MNYSSTSSRWLAVSSRDPNATSAFVYAVKTTKIFCRPNCPCRLARRANVEFYDTPTEAGLAGYRACKRCSPESISESPVDKAKQIVETHEGRVTLNEVAGKVGVSPRYLHGLFLKQTGITVASYAKIFRASNQSQSEASWSENDSEVDWNRWLIE